MWDTEFMIELEPTRPADMQEALIAFRGEWIQHYARIVGQADKETREKLADAVLDLYDAVLDYWEDSKEVAGRNVADEPVWHSVAGMRDVLNEMLSVRSSDD